MVLKKRNKPFYKQFVKLRKNCQNRLKIFKFNKQKWKSFQFHSKRQLKFYKRFKLSDYKLESTSRFTSRGNSMQKRFKNLLHQKKLFILFYGGLKNKYLKRQINKINRSKKYKMSKFHNFKSYLLEFFESRLDTVLYRSKFCLSITSARQLIKHGHIIVNNSKIKTPSFILKTDDIIEISKTSIKSRQLVKESIDKSNFWPIPPKYLIVNYNTLQIIFLYKKEGNFLPKFTYHLNLQTFR